ncbi:MAG TPA: TetR/AcrR family transcriptional regulator [Streptosporangiaceae bacterium]|nr:TetR/AcrR family transcriptional regulator [Streptosporangiaceae bacterium]
MPAAKASTAIDAGTGQAPGPAPVRRRPGRPRSELAERAIIDAALSVFAESGPDGLCIEEVAARAGVGKATIYRRWPGKEDLLLDALAALKSPLPQPLGRSVREDLVGVVDAMCRDAADPRRARQFALLQGEGAKYPRLMTRFIETVVEPRREVVRSVLRRGVATGELRDDADIEAALYLLRGAALASTGHQEPAAPDYAERVVDTLLRGLAPH